MERTLSKYWFDHEIKGIMYINGIKVIYLKPTAKRLWRYNDHLLEGKMDHINQSIIAAKNIEKFYKEIMGQDEKVDN